MSIQPDLSDLLLKAQYYLDHPLEAREIAEHGKRTWDTNFKTDSPYLMSDALWDRFVSQPGWQEFQAAYDVYVRAGRKIRATRQRARRFAY